MSVEQIYLRNDGAKLLETNYWTTSYAGRGFCYLSPLGGALRLLIPEAQRAAIQEMRNAKYVIASFGFWPEADTEGVELLFEDDSSEPFALHLPVTLMERQIGSSDMGREVPFLAYSPAGLEFEMRVKLRRVPALPCLAAWEASPPAPPERLRDRLRKDFPFASFDRLYPRELPAGFAPWHLYLPDDGHCVLALIEGHFDPNKPDEELYFRLCPAPVKAVRRSYRMLREFIVADLEYSNVTGLEVSDADIER
jgi:hypothetical protein